MCWLKLRIFITLLTFGLGIAVTVLFVSKDQNPKIAIDNNSVSSISESIKSKVNDDNVEIKYSDSLLGIESCDAIFYIQNNTNQIVYYFGSQKTENQNSWIKQNGKIKYIDIPGETKINEYELKPNESTYFWIPSPQNEKPFEAGFILRIGENRREKTILVKVTKQKKHY